MNRILYKNYIANKAKKVQANIRGRRKMSRIAQITVFLSIFLSLSFLFNYYIWFHLSFMLGMEHNIWFWIIFLLSSTIFLIAMFLETKFKNYFTKFVSVLAFIWLGYLFIMLFVLLGYDIARLVFDIDTDLAGLVIITSVSLVTLFAAFNAQYVRIRTIEIPVIGIKKNLRIVQLTDLHIGAVHGADYLIKIVKRTNELKPNIVLITGDLADGPYLYTKQDFAALNEIKAPVYFTTGNHEYYAGIDYILSLIDTKRIVVLRNEKVVINDIQIIGFDDGLDTPTFDLLLKKIDINPKKFTILMYHRPTGLEIANKYGVNLMLTGHTHSGQFFPFTLFSRLVWKRHKGLYKCKNSYLYSSSGTGTWGPPLRLGSTSEITKIELINTRT